MTNTPLLKVACILLTEGNLVSAALWPSLTPYLPQEAHP